MKAILHIPDTEKAAQELGKKVAVVHAQTVLEQIKAVSCPTEQKIKLMDAVSLLCKKEDGS